jgi:tRNA(adenine34) deaminase
MCAGASFWTRIGKIVYGAADERRGYKRITENVLHPSTEVIGGVLEEEARNLMKTFFQNKRE